MHNVGCLDTFFKRSRNPGLRLQSKIQVTHNSTEAMECLGYLLIVSVYPPTFLLLLATFLEAHIPVCSDVDLLFPRHSSG